MNFILILILISSCSLENSNASFKKQESEKQESEKRQNKNFGDGRSHVEDENSEQKKDDNKDDAKDNKIETQNDPVIEKFFKSNDTSVLANLLKNNKLEDLNKILSSEYLKSRKGQAKLLKNITKWDEGMRAFYYIKDKSTLESILSKLNNDYKVFALSKSLSLTDRETILIKAVISEDEEMVGYILSIENKEKFKYLTKTNIQKSTALDFIKSKEILAIILNSFPEAQDKIKILEHKLLANNTLLIKAVKNDNLELVKYILTTYKESYENAHPKEKNNLTGIQAVKKYISYIDKQNKSATSYAKTKEMKEALSILTKS